ncbi:hypothetical protein [Calothrix sp. PCC 6303]|uniref:hypothetical protein n=1 Tax=Calothrix sp. PCC 6303 TaxID=1170562 RepID=UPI0002A03D8E|nr:hypothetical protein [Calothrix sp. PCC 6303]AFY99593.1 hypothetical protein Cal6303_0519 [Calothrix sp. PCC 6303]
MTTNLTTPASTEFIDILTKTALAYRSKSKDRPQVEVVVNALLQAEIAAKQQKIIYPFPSMLGEWRLCFATGTKKVQRRGGIILGKGFYVPNFAKAKIAFSTNTDENLGKGEIKNSAELGFMKLQFSGLTKYWGKKNLLTFDFDKIELSLLNRTLYRGNVKSRKTANQDFYNQTTTGKLPFFAFFLTTDDFIAARGRGGGLALWIRE